MEGWGCLARSRGCPPATCSTPETALCPLSYWSASVWRGFTEEPQSAQGLSSPGKSCSSGETKTSASLHGLVSGHTHNVTTGHLKNLAQGPSCASYWKAWGLGVTLVAISSELSRPAGVWRGKRAGVLTPHLCSPGAAGQGRALKTAWQREGSGPAACPVLGGGSPHTFTAPSLSTAPHPGAVGLPGCEGRGRVQVGRRPCLPSV